jgi:hypothetical protein
VTDPFGAQGEGGIDGGLATFDNHGALDEFPPNQLGDLLRLGRENLLFL